jgi:hypothetical protein
VDQVDRPVTGCEGGNQAAQLAPETETRQARSRVPQIDHLGAEEGITSGHRFLAQGYDQEMMAAGEALNQPQQGRDDSLAAAAVYATRDNEGNLHGRACPRQMAS